MICFRLFENYSGEFLHFGNHKAKDEEHKNAVINAQIEENPKNSHAFCVIGIVS